VRFVNLGHACWLLEAGALRILFDPVLGRTHSGGTFEITPPRRIDVSSLRADFVLVSHAHPDHFDPESLALLARADPDTVLVTPDPLVAEVASTVGFAVVRETEPGTRIELDGGLVLTTTPSAAPDVECGVVATDASGCVWNMVDTVFHGPAEVRRIRDLSTAGRRVDVALAPLQPMREIALATAGWVGFDPAQYASMISCAAAVEARYVVPSAAGDAHAPPFDAMNAWVYPVSRRRAARDLAAFDPACEVLTPDLGEALVVERGDVAVGPGDVVIERLGAEPARTFRPLEPAPVSDPNLSGYDAAAMRGEIGAWISSSLAPALARELGGREDLAAATFVLEVVYPDGREATTLDALGRSRPGFDDEYTVLNVVAASMLVDVVRGRRSWGEPLLAGALRSSIRGAWIAPGAARRLSVAPMFVYYALPYRESVERAARDRASRAAAC
jgi:L-ascorbate metabolism protein UlaG (beta-lactamase superfamily)